MLINPFKQAIREGRPQIGLWSSLCSNVSAEVISGAGFDWILVDTEHAPNELPLVFSQLQGLVERHDPQLLPGIVDDPDLASANLAISPMQRFAGLKRTRRERPAQ